MIQEEVKRQCRMAFARVDQQKQNFEKRIKKQVVSPGRALAVVVQLCAATPCTAHEVLPVGRTRNGTTPALLRNARAGWTWLAAALAPA